MTFVGIPLWMSFAIIAASAGTLAFLHLLRVRSQEVRVVTTMFWRHTLEQSRARTLLERFRHPLTYALLLLIASLIALALSRPEPRAERARRTWQVIVVDAGLSMAAADAAHARTAYDAARDAAVNEAGRLSSDDRVAVVVADPWPRLVHGFDDPRPFLTKRLADCTPSAAPAATDAAVRLAESLLRGRTNPRIVLLTDRAVGMQASVPLVVRPVGKPHDNAAILSVLFEPDRENPLVGALRVRAAGWGRAAVDTRLVVRRAGGAPLFEESATIAPGTSHDFVLPGLAADGDRLEIALQTDDAVAADNRVATRLPLRAPIRVAAAPDVPAALRIALQSDPAVRFVAAEQPHDVDVVVGGPASPAPRPTIRIQGTGPSLPAGASVRPAAGAALLGDLDLENCAVGAGESLGLLPADAVVLLEADGRPVAGLFGPASRRELLLAPAIFADDATAHRRAVFPVLVGRGIRRLVAWDDDPIALEPERAVRDPRWSRRAAAEATITVAPGSREASNLSIPAPATTQAGDGASRWKISPSVFEWLLLAALAGLVLQTVLHARGRIP